MKKIYLLFFLLVYVFGFAQDTNYIITISNLNYRINKGVKNSTSSNIKIIVHYQNGTSTTAYYRSINNSGDNETNLNIDPFENPSRPVSIECYAFVNFRTGSDANNSLYTNVDSYCPSGSFDGNYSPRMSNITFNYSIEAKINVTQTTDNILPTHSKKTIVASLGYNSSYYNWQYTLTPSATSTQWIDLVQYNNSPSISVDAFDILGADTGLNIGKKIYFRIKPCSVTPGLSGVATYSIRLSAPKVDSELITQPTCSDTDDGAVKFVFNRALLDGEQLNYSLLDVTTDTPTNYNGTLAIEADKSFVISGLRKGSYMLQLIGFKDGLSTSTDADRYDLKPFIITSPPPLDFTLDVKNVQCYESQDGAITITPTQLIMMGMIYK